MGFIISILPAQNRCVWPLALPVGCLASPAANCIAVSFAVLRLQHRVRRGTRAPSTSAGLFRLASARLCTSPQSVDCAAHTQDRSSSLPRRPSPSGAGHLHCSAGSAAGTAGVTCEALGVDNAARLLAACRSGVCHGIWSGGSAPRSLGDGEGAWRILRRTRCQPCIRRCVYEQARLCVRRTPPCHTPQHAHLHGPSHSGTAVRQCSLPRTQPSPRGLEQ